MKISEFSIKLLAKAVCGDAEYTPYLKGFELVDFFNQYGFNDVYESGFPARWQYTEDNLRSINETDLLRKVIEDIVDPRRYHGKGFNLENAVKEINSFLKFDKYELRLLGDFYKITDLSGSLIQPETITTINHDFINEQVYKCQKKIFEEDFNGAITNARTLVESIFIEIIERHYQKEMKNDGNVENQWRVVKKIMKLEVDNSTLPDYVIQILSGIDTSVKGLAAFSNNAADRHANKFMTRKHHAKLAVNLAMTLSEFLLDSWNYKH